MLRWQNERIVKSAGGESTLDRVGDDIDHAHRQFQKDVEPAANFVDDKSNEAVGEGKKAANKVSGND